MPTKRASSGPDSAAKRAKEAEVPMAEWKDIVAVSKRWSKVSSSRNIDAEYKWMRDRDLEKAYSYVCICTAPFARDDDDDDEDEDEDEDEEEEGEEEEGEEEEPPKQRCDGGRTCLCDKPASEHPDHPWQILQAGKLKWLMQRSMCDIRDPDGFGMYIYNDWSAWGALEVLENLILDFVEAKGNWKEQWVVVEGMAWWLNESSSGAVYRSDDSDKVNEVIKLVGRVFLSMLAFFESKNMLSETSEVKDLGLIMGLFIKLARDVREYNLLESDEKFERFDDYVLAYATKFGITLRGPKDIDELAAECNGTVKLPVATAAKPDVWSVYTAINNFKKAYGGSLGPRSPAKIGGDHYDITAMSSAERKDAAFDKKDPLSKELIQALKNGLPISHG